MTYEIKSDVPMPRSRGGGRSIYPFGEMNIGQHFEAKIQERDRISAACNWYGKHHSGLKFSIRKIDDSTIGCWRVA